MLRALAAVVVTAAIAWSMTAHADETGRTARQQSLDEEVQQLKEEVLRIDQELRRLEERLVYPASSQMVVFLSVEPAEGFNLDAVEVRLDGEPFASHVYEFRELEALLDGGVQRLRVANVTAGGHRLEVSIDGITAYDSEYRVSESFEFEKAAGPRLIELRVVGTGGRQPSVEISSRR